MAHFPIYLLRDYIIALTYNDGLRTVPQLCSKVSQALASAKVFYFFFLIPHKYWLLHRYKIYIIDRQAPDHPFPAQIAPVQNTSEFLPSHFVVDI